MLNKLEYFTKNLRKAFFFDQKNDDMEDRDECFGFKSEKNTLTAQKTFEDLYTLVKPIKFSNRCNEFQSYFINDIKKIKEIHNLIISVDKTSNWYEITVNNYKRPY